MSIILKRAARPFFQAYFLLQTLGNIPAPEITGSANIGRTNEGKTKLLLRPTRQRRFKDLILAVRFWKKHTRLS